jgi:hypothetical protein
MVLSLSIFFSFSLFSVTKKLHPLFASFVPSSRLSRDSWDSRTRVGPVMVLLPTLTGGVGLGHALLGMSGRWVHEICFRCVHAAPQAQVTETAAVRNRCFGTLRIEPNYRARKSSNDQGTLWSPDVGFTSLNCIPTPYEQIHGRSAIVVFLLTQAEGHFRWVILF